MASFRSVAQKVLGMRRWQHIHGWRVQWWRLWSVRLNAIGLALQTLFMTWADLPLDLWNMMPGELKSHLPPRVLFALPALFFAAGTYARFVRQPKLEEKVIQPPTPEEKVNG